MKVTLNLHPVKYGDNNVIEAFLTKKMGFELQIKTNDSVVKALLDLGELDSLLSQIKTCLEGYHQFMDLNPINLEKV